MSKKLSDSIKIVNLLESDLRGIGEGIIFQQNGIIRGVRIVDTKKRLKIVAKNKRDM